MKQFRTKYLFLGSMLFITVNFSAQIGVNTPNPQGAFHVDGGKDNSAIGVPTAAQQNNDIVVTPLGRVGVGTISPSAKLEINNGTGNGAIKIIDGTQGDGKVLTSDANGVGSWKFSAPLSVNGVTPTGIVHFGTATDKYMGAYIDLSPGQWIIYLGFLINGASAIDSYYASRLTLSSSSSAIATSGFSFVQNNNLLFTTFSTGGKGGSAYGFFSSGIIRVNVTAATKLYVWDSNSRLYSNYPGPVSPYFDNNGENYIFAVRAN